MLDTNSSFKGIIKSLGLVFGDIGTSPIYTLTVIILLTPPTIENVIGVLSLIVWTLIILVTVEYAWLAMSLGKRGEGGTIVLRELLVPLLTTGRQVSLVTLLSFIGISLIIGDGVITPAISILSAVEGLLLIKGLEGINQTSLVVIAGAIAVLLFSFQKKGTERVAGAFGPLMLVWFAVLSISGLASIIQVPMVIKWLILITPLFFFLKMALQVSSYYPKSYCAQRVGRHFMPTWAISAVSPSSGHGFSFLLLSCSTISARELF